MLEAYALYVVAGGALLGVIGFLWLVVRAFRQRVWWGLAVVVFPPAGLLFTGLGIGVTSAGADGLWAHGGGLFGTSAFACRPQKGWAWAVIFNSAPLDFLNSSPNADFDGDLLRVISVDALESVSWPASDLFPQYLPSGRPTVAPGGVVNAA